MKLAEALQERADLETRLQQLRRRLSVNATVQEGESPAEDPRALLKEADACCDRLQELVSAVNHTNAVTQVNGVSLTALISKRDALTRRISLYRDFLLEASNLPARAARSEIKIMSTVDVSKLQKKVDELSRELRLCDNALQQANWSTELII